MSKTIFTVGDLLGSRPSGPRVLIYHQVGAGLGRQMEVTLDDFTRQLDWLVDNREIVDLTTAISRWPDPGSERLVVLTFDDGYRDTYEVAFPLLEERGCQFTLYLSTEHIENPISRNGVDVAPALTWPQVRAMVGSGLGVVGAHTHTHADLRRLAADEIEVELDRSDSLIEDRVGIRPAHFAYPWGYWSSEAEPFVKARYASAVLGGSPKPSAIPDVHRIHRYPVQLSDSFTFFRSRLSGGLRMEESLRRRLRGYRGP